ncbi:hypothetical protein HanPI659440_Chr08g0304811 [Helianthus annuus]|nr:hypothetical protein HanPI659440_Chr08g0304811 [Helianthus annuus]
MGPQYFSNGHDFGHHGNSSIESSGIVGVMGYLEGTRACLESTKSGNDLIVGKWDLVCCRITTDAIFARPN